MKNEKGITLVALGVTIIVLSILAAVSISTGKKTIEGNKVIAFINELKIVQSEVNIIVEKQRNGDTSYDSIGTKISDLDTETLAKLASGCFKGKTAEEMAEFKYYKISDLKKMGIDNVEQEVVINLKTREVLSVNGIQDSGKMCYKLEDFPSESYNVAEYIPIVSEPIEDLVVNGKVEIGDYVAYNPTGDESYSVDGNVTGSGSPQTINQEKLNWRIVDMENGKVRLISEAPTQATLTLQGANGYNNAVYILNDLCNKLYSGKNAVAKSMRIEDIKEKLNKSVWDYNTHPNLGTVGTPQKNNILQLQHKKKEYI